MDVLLYLSLCLILLLTNCITGLYYYPLGGGTACKGTTKLTSDTMIDWDLSQLVDSFPTGWLMPDKGLGPTKLYHFTICQALPGGQAECDNEKDWCMEVVNLNGTCRQGIANWQESEETIVEYSAILNSSDLQNANIIGLHVSVLDDSQFNITCPNKHSIVNYNAICEANETGVVRGIHENITNCLWNISIHTKYACASIRPWDGPSTTVDNGGDGSSSKTDLSVGSVVLIILIVILLTYLILGCAYNSFYHGRVGLDAIPNKNAWTQCGRYTRAGCETSRDTVCCGGTGTYQELS